MNSFAGLDDSQPYLSGEAGGINNRGLKYIDGARVRTRDDVEDVVAAGLVVAVVAGSTRVKVDRAKSFHRAVLKIEFQFQC